MSMSLPMGNMADAVPVEPMRAFNGLGGDERNVGGAGGQGQGGGGPNGGPGSGGGGSVAGGGKKKPGLQGQGRAVELPPVIAASA
jgi:transcriptional activator SPT7